MKKIIFAFALFFSWSYNAQTKEEVFTMVEEMPVFNGGNEEMSKYISKEIKYPKAAKDAKIGGKVFVKFIVNRDGSVKDAVVLKGAENCADCDKEALRVISSMPKWTPGKQNGKAVSCYFTIPIKFDPV